jgi:hypothetical protein
LTSAVVVAVGVVVVAVVAVGVGVLTDSMGDYAIQPHHPMVTKHHHQIFHKVFYRRDRLSLLDLFSPSIYYVIY